MTPLKYSLSILFMVVYYLAYSQTQFWGTTSRGGESGTGTIFKTNNNGNAHTRAYSFNVQNEGFNPQYNTLLNGQNGKLYGMVPAGGAYGIGVLYSYNPTDSTYQKLHDFSINDGYGPQGALVQLPNGLIYGLTNNGGANSLGTLFSFNPATLTYTKLHDFTGLTTGSRPQGGLLYASDGMLYGVTREGGTSNIGTIFQFNPLTNVFTKKYDFSNTTGSSPMGTLTQGTDGNLYGTTQQGGLSFTGTIFKFDPVTSVFTHITSFNGASNGAFPYDGMIQLPNGLFYGLTQTGGVNGAGAIYQFNPTTQTTTLLYSFSIPGGGGNMPMGKLILHTNGKLYGTTGTGGANNNGTIFEFDPVTLIYTKIADFNASVIGKAPLTGLTIANNGLLYGVTSVGGFYDFGVCFRINPTTQVLNKCFEFGQIHNGRNPTGSLLYASDGMLYGMTESGGTNNAGIIYRFNPGTNQFTKLFDFNPVVSGKTPTSSLIQTPDGKLYGMTRRGGNNDLGVLFRFDPVTLAYSKLVDFSGTSNGALPSGSLLLASNGRLYGTTIQGGTNNRGVLFEYNPANNLFTKRCDFGTPAVVGTGPRGTLIQASNNKLYGVTSGSFSTINTGYIFEFDYLTNSYTALYQFPLSTFFMSPAPILSQAPNGKFYALTATGGLYGNGTLYEYNRTTNTLNFKHDFFTPDSGNEPDGGLMLASNGKYYGIASKGGSAQNNTFGTLFEYDYLSDTLIVKHVFEGPDGAFPGYLKLVEIPFVFSVGNIPASICAGTTTALPFFLNDSCDAGNSFTAQLSDLNGSFASPINIGSLSGRTSDTIQVTIPANMPAGNNYRIRVISSIPSMISAVSSTPLSILPQPLLTVSNNISICSGDSALLVASSSLNNFVWQPAIGLNTVTGDSVIAFPLSTTSYSVSVTDNNGCTGVRTLNVTVNPLPITIVPDTFICAGSCISWNANGASTYSWTPATGLSSTTSASPLCCANVAGIYFITGTDSLGCSSVDTATLAIRAIPSVQAGSDTTICEFLSVQLQGNGGISASWSPSSTLSNPLVFSPFASPSVTTTYILTVTGNNSCTNIDSITIFVNQAPAVFAGADTAVCFGQSVQLNGSGGISCIWQPSNTLNSATLYTPVSTPINTTNYILSVTDSIGCFNSDTVSVTVNPLPPVPTITQFGPTLFSSASSGNQWYLNSNLLAGATNTTLVPQTNGNYEVVVTDSNGCMSQSGIYFFGSVSVANHNPPAQTILFKDVEGGNIVINSPLAESGVLKIYDFTGKLVFQEHIETNNQIFRYYLPQYCRVGYIVNWCDSGGSWSVK
ncbi:MAG: hypothetical protein IM638_12555 [Bacteroidetes bacterium]|nr:hypothetical protein [Bacteroidota bacterium]